MAKKAKKTSKYPDDSVTVTKDGLEELKAELQELIDVKRPLLVQRIAHARAQGDLSENADYQNAKEEQQLLEARIERIEEIIANAKIVANTTSHDKVGMGSTVQVQLTGKKAKTYTYHMVGEFEAKPAEGKVSVQSPLGKALMGKKKGDTVEVTAPAGKLSYTIISIK